MGCNKGEILNLIKNQGTRLVRDPDELVGRPGLGSRTIGQVYFLGSRTRTSVYF